MVLEPIPLTPSAPPGIVVTIGGAELFDDLHAALGSGETFRRVFGPALVADPSVRLAVGYFAGEPVSGAAAVRTEQTIGVYAVGTVKGARRRGIGRAVTWAAIDAGRAAWGGSIAILQSSEMGIPVYRSMGFEEVSRYVGFERPKG
jgi:GNAT superfamily N-acetyltransferase